MSFTEVMCDPCSTVSQAARLGDLQQLKTLVEEGHPVDVSDNRGWKPTHEASFGNYVACLQELLKQDTTDVNWRSHEGATALFIACQERHTECVKVLLEAGADPNSADHVDNYPLLEAVKSDCMEIIELLVDHNANLNCQLYCGTSPLHQAASEGMTHIVSYLLQKGARLDIKEDYNITPIFSAAHHGQDACLQLLLEHAKNTGVASLVNFPADDGATPLYLASQEGHLACVRTLLAYGADANIMTVNEPRALPLQAALEFAHVECVQELVQVTDPRCFDDCDTSPWYTLFCGGDYKMRYTLAKALLDGGLDPNYQHKKDLEDNYTRFPKILRFSPTQAMLFYKCIRPLTKASFFESALRPSRLVELLIDRGAYINARSMYELPPLIPALENAKTAVMDKLVQSGAEIDLYHPKIQGNLTLLLSMHRWKSFNFLLNCGAETGSLFNEAKYFYHLEKYKNKLKAARRLASVNTSLNAAGVKNDSVAVVENDFNEAPSSEMTEVTGAGRESDTDEEYMCSVRSNGGAQNQQDIIESMSFIPFDTFLMAARQVMSSGPYHVTVSQVLYRLVYYSGTVHISGKVLAYLDCEKDRQDIAQMTETPRTMAHLCRVRIRESIGPNRLFQEVVTRERLGLPRNILDFIFFKEMEDMKR